MCWCSVAAIRAVCLLKATRIIGSVMVKSFDIEKVYDRVDERQICLQQSRTILE